MSEQPGTEGDTERSYRLDRLAGFSVIGAFVFSLALLFVGEPLFWVPFLLGLGIGLPGFAILADRERDRDGESGPATADEAADDE
ncbi:hypothetical protein [Halolamina sp. C58]|uniref:hypothetical protein n=1 Tax=Halolamina sp. C58 TaxID=3421640 RepID=UPI003EBA4CFD